MQYSASVASNIGILLEGASDPDPDQFGRTTEEEMGQSGFLQVRLHTAAIYKQP